MTPHDYLAKIQALYKKLRRMPSYSEILAGTGLKSKNAIHKITSKLVEADMLGKDRRGKLIPGRRWPASPDASQGGHEVRLLGTVAAGWPSPAEEELLDTMSLEEYLIENKEATFMLKVSGDSMKDAGIMPGDMVLVERRSEARNGDIVIAEVDHQWTMKYYRKTGGVVRLIPANDKYSPITPKEQLNISAIVKAVIRKY